MSAARPAGTPGAAPVPRPTARRGTALLALALLLLLALAAKCAWASDDAYITFRVVDNFVAGHGLRWNVDERVQAFTHPSWALLVSAFYAFTGEPYWTSIVLSLALTAATAAWLGLRIAPSRASGAAAVLLLASSKAFADFSTSGLENPLVHLLVALAWSAQLGLEASSRRTLSLVLLASLLAVTRLDALVLVLPAIAADLLEQRKRIPWAAVALGSLPLLAWEAFSLVYYGFLLPNTAYAKLGTGIPERQLVVQGLAYLGDSLRRDPITLATIAAAVIAAGVRRSLRWRAAALGIAAHVAYVVWIGGDFMSGRFLTPAFVASACVLARFLGNRVPLAAVASAATLALVGMPLSPLRAPLDDSAVECMGARGIADERACWWSVGGALPRWTGTAVSPAGASEPGVKEDPEGDPRSRVRVAVNIGYYGFAVGPEVHVVDPLGLADPLLARLPVWRGEAAISPETLRRGKLDWRIGHFARALPRGYLRSLRDPEQRIADPAVAELRAELDVLTRGPLWTGERWRLIEKHLVPRLLL
jgi:arabinofuranosyltransferase